MTSIVFVHGTGVREVTYNSTFDQISKQLSGQSDFNLVPCYWGNLGADLHLGGVSIPNYEVSRRLQDEEYEVALWGLLYEDPLYELRLLLLRQETKGVAPPGRLPPGPELERRVHALQPSDDLITLLQRADLEQVFQDAKAAILRSSVFRESLRGAGAGLLNEYRAAVARAIFAEAVRCRRMLEGAGEQWKNAEYRDEIVDLLIESMGGIDKERALGWIKEKTKRLAMRIGTNYVQNRRSKLTDVTSPTAGDILFYQARGERIRQLIRQLIREANQPIVLLAHSLGGVACVDLLISEALPVELLITVGSQAPFFYEIDALTSLSVNQPLPDHFPRWLNIYDLRDLLSYVGEPVFRGKVKDILVNNKQPFPISHSAYWSNSEVWANIAEVLP